MTNDATLRALQRALDGTLVLPDHPSYDSVRRLWNAMIDRRPAVIARCLSDADVAISLRFARDHNLPIAVRGGGHNVAGNASCDGGLVIDLSRMREVTVNPHIQTATVAGGATWADVDLPSSVHGLHTTGGVVSTTGVAGLTLGGGMGWLSRLHGHTCDNLIAARVVTAYGEVVTASETENRDLLWGLRGGGGNFGVVTSFEFRLHPITTVVGGWMKYPWIRARSVLETYRDLMKDAPDNLAISAILMTDADLGLVVGVVPCYVGSAERAEPWMEALRAVGPPIVDEVVEKPYIDHQRIFETPPPPRMGHYWKSNFLNRLDQSSIEALIDSAAFDPRPGFAIAVETMGGAASRVEENHAAFANRKEPYNYLADAGWVDPEDADTSIAWARHAYERMSPYASGANYINYMSEDDEPNLFKRLAKAYGRDRSRRLVELKDAYDPENLFRLNHNIPPSSGARDK